MNNLEKQFKNAAQDVRLESAERARMNAYLLEHMKAHPLSVEKNWARKFNFLPYASFACALLIMSGGVAWAAEVSLPSEPLYPIKIHVTEAVRGSLTFSQGSRAEWETRRMERRLEEAEDLAVAGKLTPQVEAEVASEVEAQAGVASREIKALPQEDATAVELENRVAASLGAHEAILAKVAVSDKGEGGEKLIGLVQQVASVDEPPVVAMSFKASAMVAPDSDVSPVSELLVSQLEARVEGTLAALQQRVASLEGKDEQSIAEIQKQITQAGLLLESARKSSDEGDNAQALDLLRQDLKLTQKINVYLSAEARLNIRFFSSSRSKANTSTATSTPQISAEENEAKPTNFPPTPQEHADELNQVLKDLKDTGKQTEALDESVKDAQALILRGRAALDRGDEDRAAELFDEANVLVQGFTPLSNSSISATSSIEGLEKP